MSQEVTLNNCNETWIVACDECQQRAYAEILGVWNESANVVTSAASLASTPTWQAEDQTCHIVYISSVSAEQVCSYPNTDLKQLLQLLPWLLSLEGGLRPTVRIGDDSTCL